MNDPIELRKTVRLILSAMPKSRPRASEELLIAQCSRRTAEPVKLPELREALEWNHARGYVDFRHNQDEERDEWFLAPAGQHKEGLA